MFTYTMTTIHSGVCVYMGRLYLHGLRTCQTVLVRIKRELNKKHENTTTAQHNTLHIRIEHINKQPENDAVNCSLFNKHQYISNKQTRSENIQGNGHTCTPCLSELKSRYNLDFNTSVVQCLQED